MARLTRADRAEAAWVIEALLDAVRAGDLDAGSPQGRRLLRRLEGAAAALRAQAA